MTADTYVIKARVDYPDVGVLAGDSIAAEKAMAADPGALVVVMREEGATVKRCEVGDEVIGRVLQVWGSRG